MHDRHVFAQHQLDHRQHAQSDRAGPGNQHGLDIGMDQLARRIAWPPVPMMSSSSVASVGGRSTGHGKEEVLVDQFIDPIAAVAVEAHVAALGQALVGKSLPAGAALAAEVHQKDRAGRPDGVRGPRTRRGHDPGGLMARA